MSGLTTHFNLPNKKMSIVEGKRKEIYYRA
jgi:hypothetical protein